MTWNYEVFRSKRQYGSGKVVEKSFSNISTTRAGRQFKKKGKQTTFIMGKIIFSLAGFYH